MNDNAGGRASDAEPDRLAEVVAEYLDAVDRGEAPDRREFVARRPDLAAGLEAFFRARDGETDLARLRLEVAKVARVGEAFVPATALLHPDPSGRARAAGTAPHRRFGEYELLGEIGSGGMGVVYRARHVSLDRVVALKMIRPGFLDGAAHLERFAQEARAAAALDHPGIIPLYEAGECAGQPYFTMAIVEGPSLEERIQPGPLPPRAAAELVRAVAEAVHYAHERGILHRDLKPANVLVAADGRPRVADFGLAKRLGESGPTTAGQVLGTPSYMAPEQAMGRSDRAGVPADVYALGAILYALVTGRPPFQAPTALETLRLVAEEEPVPPRRLNREIPRDLEIVALRCLEKDARGRYPSARELARDLGRFLDDKPIHARPSGPAGRVWKWARRQPVVAVLWLAVLGIAGAGIGGVAAQWNRAERNLYASRVALAARERDAGELGTARDLLAECPEAHRGWEWAFLRRQCHPERAQLDVPASIVSDVAWRAGGHEVVATKRAGAIVCEAATGRSIHDVRLDPNEYKPPLRIRSVGSTASSPDGRHMVWHDSDTNELAVGDLARAQETARIAVGQPDFSICIANGGRQVAWTDGGVARVWTADTGTAIEDRAASWEQVRLAADGSRWARVARGRVDVGPLPAGETAVWEDPRIIGLALDLALDGRRVAASARLEEGRHRPLYGILVKDADSARPRELAANVEEPRILEFSPDAKLLAAVDRPGTLWIWDVATGDVLLSDAAGPWVKGLSFSPDGRRIALAGSAAVTIRDVPVRREACRLAGSRRVWCAVPSPDLRRLAVGEQDGAVRLVEFAGGREERVLQGPPRPVSAAAFSPDGRLLAVASGTLAPVRIEVYVPRKPGPVPANSAVSPGSTSSLVARGGSQVEVRLWDLTREAEPRLLGSADSLILDLAFRPDGRCLVAATFTGLRLWDLETGESRVLRREPFSAVAKAAFSPDGRWVATAHLGGRIVLSDAEDGTTRWEGDRGDALVQGFAFTSDGSQLAAVLGDGSVVLHDAGTGQVVVTLRPRAGDAAAFALEFPCPSLAGETYPLVHAPLGWARFSPGDERLWTMHGFVGTREPVLRGELREWDASPLPAGVGVREPASRWDRASVSRLILAGCALLFATCLFGLTRMSQRPGIGAVFDRPWGGVLNVGAVVSLMTAMRAKGSWGEAIAMFLAASLVACGVLVVLEWRERVRAGGEREDS